LVDNNGLLFVELESWGRDDRFKWFTRQWVIGEGVESVCVKILLICLVSILESSVFEWLDYLWHIISKRTLALVFINIQSQFSRLFLLEYFITHYRQALATPRILFRKQNLAYSPLLIVC
jgi:hypothetical protein